MVTRTQENTKTLKVWLATRYLMPTCLMADVATAPIEPTCFKQASKDPKWRQSMDTEMNLLLYLLELIEYRLERKASVYVHSEWRSARSREDPEQKAFEVFSCQSVKLCGSFEAA